MQDFINQLLAGAKVVENVAGNAAKAVTSGKSPDHTKTNGAISNGPVGQFAQSAGEATNPNNGDTYGNAEAKYGPNSPQAYGALAGSALPALGFDSAEATPATQTVSASAKAGKQAVGDATDIVKNSLDETMANAHAQPGGLQAGFVRPSSYTKPEIPAGETPGNGDQFVNSQAGQPLEGGTPAQVKARPTQPVSMQYNPGGAMKPPTEDGLPPLGETPQQGVPPINTNPAQDTQSATMEPQQDPYARTYQATEDSHTTPTAQARGIQMDKSNVKNTADQKQINATLDGYGITHDSHYNQFQANDRQLGMLSKDVAQHLADNPGTINKGQLVNDIAFDFMKNDMFGGDELGAAQRVVDSAFKRSASDQMLTQRTIAPDEISGQSAMLMKSRAGDDSARTFNQPDDTKWTENQKAARIVRDNLDHHIDTKWPQVAKMNNDMSDMISARPQLRDNANTEIKGNQDQILNPKAKPKGNNPVGSIIKTGAKILPFAIPAAIAGKEVYDNQEAQSASLKQNLADTTNNQTPEQGKNNSGENVINHAQTVSQNPANVNQTDPLQIQPNKDGTWGTSNIYQLKDANGKSVVMDTQTYKKLSGQIATEKEANQGNQAALDALNTAQGQLDKTYGSTQNLRDLHDTTTTALQSINDAQTMLKNKAADPSFADMFQVHLGPVDIGAQNIHEGISADYKALRQQLVTVDNAFPQLGLDVQSANSTEAAQKLLTQAAQKIIAYENQHLQNVVGGSQTTAPSGQSTVPPGPAADTSSGSNVGTQGGPPALGDSYQFTPPNPMFQPRPIGQ